MGRRRRGASAGTSKLSRRSALLLIGGGGLLTVSGVGAYSAVTGDRAFDLGTSADPNALMAMEFKDQPSPIIVTDGNQVTLFDVTNYISTDPASVTVSVIDDGGLDLNISTPTSLYNGETGQVTAVVSCDDPGQRTITLRIQAEGTEGRVDAVREITIVCQAAEEFVPISNVRFRGAGNVNTIESPEDVPITIDVWYWDGGGNGRGPGGRGGNAPPLDGSADDFGVVCSVETSTNEPVQPDIPGGLTGIVAVKIHEADPADRYWHHPEFDPETRRLEHWGQGDQPGVRWPDEPDITETFANQCDDE